MGLTTIVYTSRATRPMDDAALTGLLTVARDRNRRQDVSGMLVYALGSFMQQLEGEAAAIDAIFASIEHDPRHTDLRVLSRRPVSTRRFEGWSMGFEHPDAEALAPRLPGFRSTMQAPLVNSQLIVDTEIAETVLELCAIGGTVTRR